MKKIALLLIAVLALNIFTGCIESNKLSSDAPVTLNMWHVYGSQTKSPLNDAIDEFNKTVGRENGIIVNIVSVTSSSAIDKALLASANNEPGADELPDLFTAYPRVAEIVGKENLLAWDEYFSKDELSEFSDDFIFEGYFDSKLLMLPIAKSSEAFYVNKTLFDRFCEQTGTDYSSLSSYDGIFKTAELYYDTTGSDFMQFNDHYHYFLLGMYAAGEELITDGRINCESAAFEDLWDSLARCAIHGGICLDDGYAATRWKTAEIISNIGSTADILYQPDMVIYADNTSEPIKSVLLPYPAFGNAPLHTIYRGGGLFAIKSEDERKNNAAYIFAKWITQKENNLDFVTQAGYLPVKKEAFDTLFEGKYHIESENCRQLYETVKVLKENYTFVPVPLFEGASDVQHNFETNIKFVLKSARNRYAEGVSDGQDEKQIMDELVSSALDEFRVLCAS